MSRLPTNQGHFAPKPKPQETKDYITSKRLNHLQIEQPFRNPQRREIEKRKPIQRPSLKYRKVIHRLETMMNIKNIHPTPSGGNPSGEWP